MKKSKITNLDILGITPETEDNIPSQITDLDDGSTIINSIASLENNKQDNLSQTQLDAVNSGITAGKIMQSPYTTSETNPLVNQDFVNSSIATNTANFIGTFSNIVDLETYSGTLTNNDYAFVTNKVINNGNPFNSFNDMISYVTPVINYVVNYDYAFITNATDNTKIDVYRYDISKTTIAQRWGENNPVATAIDINDFQKNPAYNRYKYNGNTWEFEYTLNNSSFTAAQWAAINSGVTNGNVEQIATNTINITNLQNSKQDKLTAGTNITIDANNVINTKDVITLGTEVQEFEGNKRILLKEYQFTGLRLQNKNNSLQFIDINPSSNKGTSSFPFYKPYIYINSDITGNNDLYIFGDRLKRGDDNNLFLPDKTKSGTLALTSDIPDTSNFVDLNTTTQTFDGNKILNLDYGKTLIFRYSDNNYITINPNNGEIQISRGGSANLKTTYSGGRIRQQGYTMNFPTKDGTFALTSDIPTAMTNAEIDTIMDAILV